MANAEPTVPVQAIAVTALCDAHRHQLCPGKIVSATPAHGQPCTCSCHRREEVAA